jgi:hypothetical protein
MEKQNVVVRDAKKAAEYVGRFPNESFGVKEERLYWEACSKPVTMTKTAHQWRDA